jgi:hypothetical protein
VRAELRKLFWLTSNLVTAIPGPLVGAMHVSTRCNEERDVMEPRLVP